MPRVAETDPIRDFKFSVAIHPTGRLRTVLGANTSGSINLGFAVVTGLSVNNEVVSYREGGMNTHPHYLVGQSSFSPVTFSRGVFYEQNQLYNWQQFIHAWNSGALPGSTSGANDYRCTIGVRILDHPASGSAYVNNPGTPDTSAVALPPMRLGYVLYNCWPSTFAMTDLNANSSSLLVQQLSVVHEGFRLVNNQGDYEAAIAGS